MHTNYFLDISTKKEEKRKSNSLLLVSFVVSLLAQHACMQIVPCMRSKMCFQFGRVDKGSITECA